MKKILFTVFCACGFVSTNLNAQQSTLQQVAGTSVFLEPPTGFVKSSRFLGFEQVETQSSLMVIPMKVTSASALKKMLFSEEKLQERNMELKGKHTVTLNGEVTELYYVEQQTPLGLAKKIIRILTDKEQLILLNGIYLESHEDSVFDALYDAIFSAEIQAVPEPQAFDHVNYEFAVSPDWEVRNPDNMPTVITLKQHAAPEHSTPMDWPLVIVTQSYDERALGSLRSANIEMLKDLRDFKLSSIQSEQSRDVAGLKAYLIKSEGSDVATGQPLFCWQLLIRDLDNKGYYRMVALGSDLETDAKMLVDGIMNTFTLKTVE